MKLTHETGVATLLQFIILGLLHVIGTINSTVAACRSETSGCIVDVFVSSILFLMIMTGLGFVCLLGYMAQDRRSRRFSQALIASEAFIALIAVGSLKFSSDVLGQITSVVAFVSAAWIILMAVRIMRSGGQRITTRRAKQRPRQRRRPTS